MSVIPDLIKIFRKVPWGWAIDNGANQELLMVNPALAPLHGYTVAELRGQCMHTLVAPESLPDFRGHVRRSRENGHHIFESQRRHKNGIAFPVRENLATYKDVSGNPDFHSLMVHDLSVPPQVDAKLREWRTGVEISKDAIITADTTDKIIFWDRGARKSSAMAKRNWEVWTSHNFAAVALRYCARFLLQPANTGHRHRENFYPRLRNWKSEGLLPRNMATCYELRFVRIINHPQGRNL